jgi:hypothetical protein
MSLTQEIAKDALHSSTPKLSAKQRFALSTFPNWAELFQYLQTRHGGFQCVQPRGLIGLQHLWPPERRFDAHQLDDLGAVAGFTLVNPRQTVFCSGDLVQPLTSNLVAAGSCSLRDILEHWVAPIEAERLSRAVSKGNLLLWTSAYSQV